MAYFISRGENLTLNLQMFYILVKLIINRVSDICDTEMDISDINTIRINMILARYIHCTNFKGISFFFYIREIHIILKILKRF